MINMNGFHIGLGFGYKSYTCDQVRTIRSVIWEDVVRVLHPVSASITQFSPVGELGYTFASD